MARDFAESMDINATLLRALSRIVDFVDAEGGALFLLDDARVELTCTSCVGATDITGIKLRADQGIIGRTVQANAGEIVRDARTDPSFYSKVDEQTGFTTKSILCAPMSVHEERLGAIELVNKRGNDPRFTATDLRVLETMAASAALALVNARMAEALVEQERVRRELELAAEIQRSLLPARQDGAFPIHGVNFPARIVSGDFFDFFTLPDGRICFNLGDVSGKGMDAALLMAKTASLYRCLGKSARRPGRLLARINAEICETSTRGMFVTMVGGLYDPATGIVRFSNAGHEPPLLHGSDGTFQSLPAESPPLGIVPLPANAAGFPEAEIQLDGGTLYIFTDGVTEGYLEGGATLQVEGFKEVIRHHADRPVADRLDAVINLFNRRDGALRDDLTVLAIDDGGPVEVRQTAREPNVAAPRSTPPVGERLCVITVPARADRLKLIRDAVTDAAMLSGCGEETVRDLVLAVDEACQNVIRHAYSGNEAGDMVVDVRREDDEIVVLLRDFAAPVDVTKVKPRDIDDVKPGGLGTYLMQQCMDEVTFMPPPADGGNLLRMAKKIN